MSMQHKMLIVDDAEICRVMLRKIFSGEYEILEASNGREAMDILEREQAGIQAVILDIQMPVMDGFAVLREMEKNASLREIPVIVATAEDSVESETSLLELGAAEVLHKPFHPDIAQKRVNNIVHRNLADRQRRSIIQKQTATFIINYDYRSQTLYVDPFYRNYIDFDINSLDVHDLSWLNAVAYRPDVPVLLELFDLSLAKTSLSRSVTARFAAAGGGFQWFRLFLTCQVNGQGEKEQLSVIVNNVDQEIAARKELEFLAESDQLTRIPNKGAFLNRARRLLDENPDVTYVVARLDVERFRIINQLHGAAEGDSVLRYIAVKIQEYVEAEGHGAYCRLESDAFALCLPYEEEAVAELEQYINEALAIYPLKFDIRVSFGYYVVKDRQDGVSIMLDRAFAAQKSIKGSFLRCSAYYDDNLRQREAIEQRIITQMSQALANGEFQVYLQPKYDMKSHEILGSEALVRWVHPTLGLISPGAFIPVFGKNGFIMELDQYMIEACCRIIRRWMDEGRRVLPISVNISRTDLYNPQLFSTILRTVDSYELPHDYIEFELTESSFVLDSAPLTNLNNELRRHGFRVLMDDFGSGYSSLNSLRELQVDVLKIDLKFLPTSSQDMRARAILSAVVDMAKKLDLDIVAEGVETEDQREFLLSINCQVGQGYYFRRPMTVADYEAALGEAPDL